MIAARDPAMWLRDIVLAAEKLAQLVLRGKTSFDEDWMTSDLIVHELEIIGEAACALPADFRCLHPEVEWRRAIDMRNRLIHGYVGIDYEMVWSTAVNDIPPLRELIVAILTGLEESTA